MKHYVDRLKQVYLSLEKIKSSDRSTINFLCCVLENRLTELEEERLQILSQLERESKAKEDAEAKAQALHNDVQALNEQAKLQIFRRKLKLIFGMRWRSLLVFPS